MLKKFNSENLDKKIHNPEKSSNEFE